MQVPDAMIQFLNNLTLQNTISQYFSHLNDDRTDSRVITGQTHSTTGLGKSHVINSQVDHLTARQLGYAYPANPNNDSKWFLLPGQCLSMPDCQAFGAILYDAIP